MTARITRATTTSSISAVLAALPDWKEHRPFISSFLQDKGILVLKSGDGRKAFVTLQEGEVPLQKWATDRGDPGGWYIPADPNKGVWDISVPEALAKGVEDSNPPDPNWVPPHVSGEPCEFCHDTGFAPYGCAACGQ